MEIRDDAVIAAVRSGDREAYRVLVDRYRDRLIGVLMRMTCDRNVAEELAQETFVRAYERLADFRGDALFGTWLVQIGIHLLRDRARWRRRHIDGKIVSLDELRARADFGGDPAAPARATDSLDRMCREEWRQQLDGALRELPPEYREVLVLKHLEEWSYEQIASVTGATPGTLKVRAHRARQLLRELIAAPENGMDRRGDVGPHADPPATWRERT
jgi:RNA polymerase sigma-70 factor (ECF subfamily)